MAFNNESNKIDRVAAPFSFGLWLLLAASFFERFSYYGLTLPFLNYLQNPPGNADQPGALGLGQSKAVTIIYVFTILVYACPLMGAVIGDNWGGRYRTAIVSLCIYLVGEAVLFATSALAPSMTTAKTTGFALAMVLVSIGVGGTKPNLSALLGDQFESIETTIVKTKDGIEIAADKDLTFQRLYAMNYWLINVGALSGIATTILERYVGYWTAFLVPFCGLCLALGALLLSARRLHRPKAEKNVFPQIMASLYQGAMRGFSMDALKQSQRTTLPQRLGRTEWSPAFISDVQDALRAIRVFVAFVVANLSYDQMSTNMISQALQMQTHGVPNDQLFNLNAIFVMILLPLWERVLSPCLGRFFRLGPIVRINIGFIFVTLAMGYTLGVQVLIYKTAPCYDHPLTCTQHRPNNVNVAVQIPTYFLLAVSEIFTNVAGMEYAYTKAPRSMKSLIQAMFAFMWALGSICGIALSPLAQNPYLVILFAVLCGGMVVTTVVFWLCFRDEVKTSGENDGIQGSKDDSLSSNENEDRRAVEDDTKDGKPG